MGNGGSEKYLVCRTGGGDSAEGRTEAAAGHGVSPPGTRQNLGPRRRRSRPTSDLPRLYQGLSNIRILKADYFGGLLSFGVKYLKYCVKIDSFDGLLFLYAVKAVLLEGLSNWHFEKCYFCGIYICFSTYTGFCGFLQ